MSGAKSALPWIAALSFLVAALSWLGQEQRLETQVFDAGSVLNTSGAGLSLAQRYLQEEPAPVRVLTRPLTRAHVVANAVVFRVRPTTLPFRLASDDETEGDDGEAKDKDDKKPAPRREARPRLAPLLAPAEEEWVRGGGRLVLALQHDYGRIEVRPREGWLPAVKVFPQWPQVRRLNVDDMRVLVHGSLPEAHALFIRGESPVVTRAHLGRGDLIVLACPEVLDNAHLGKDHLPLLHALAGTGRPVYFDEYVHGVRSETGLLDLLTGWGLGPLLFSLGVLCLAAFGRARMRLGPPDEAYRDVRSDAVDLLDSLAQLYNRTLRREEAVRLYFENLRHAASLKTGLRGRALEGRMKQLLGTWTVPRAEGRADLTAAVFDQAVRSINDGFRRLEEHAHPR